MSDLYGHLQWLAYRLAIVNAHADLVLIFLSTTYIINLDYIKCSDNTCIMINHSITVRRNLILVKCSDNTMVYQSITGKRNFNFIIKRYILMIS